MKRPRISDIQIWRNRKDLTDDRNAVFQIHHALCVAADVDYVIVRPHHGRSGFRIRNSHIADNIRNRADHPEIETADIEIAAHKEPLVVRDSSPTEPTYCRCQEP